MDPLHPIDVGDSLISLKLSLQLVSITVTVNRSQIVVKVNQKKETKKVIAFAVSCGCCTLTQNIETCGS